MPLSPELLFPLLAASPTGPGALIPPLVASVIVGAAIFVFVWTMLNTLYSEDLEQDLAWRYDVNRINELRKLDTLYRLFHPLVQIFARFNRATFPDQMRLINREILASGLSRFWTPEEYLAKLEIVALLLMPAYMYVFVDWFGSPGWVMAVAFTFMTAYFLRVRLASNAAYRLLQIKRRMPYLLDLLTLLMEAGSTFIQALKQAVDQFGGHPVGQEFGRVLAEISMGKGRMPSLEAMRDRLQDDEITSIIGSITQGEQLGTPLARLFRTQADVLRIKRSQRAETIAGEAGAQMLLPAVLVMGATVIVILGPFILGFLYAEFM